MKIQGPTSHQYISQRTKLNYHDWGNPDAPPLLMVHGGRDHARSWDWAAEELRDDFHIIAPDLRGHGNSEWSQAGNYIFPAYTYDIAQLIHQLELSPVTIIAHSMGGAISLRYAGLFPETVSKMIVVEGAFPSPKSIEENKKSPVENTKNWIESKRNMASRFPKRYASLDEALERMKIVNKFLSDEQARHLTIHGASQNEDGTYSWKFDHYLHTTQMLEPPTTDIYEYWKNISCPVLLCYGSDSWMEDPSTDERLGFFQNAQVKIFEEAGHWLHHDQFDKFMAATRNFLKD